MVVTKAVGLAVEIDDDRAVLESVERGGSDGGVAEVLTRRADPSIGRDHDAGFQIALGASTVTVQVHSSRK